MILIIKKLGSNLIGFLRASKFKREYYRALSDLKGKELKKPESYSYSAVLKKDEDYIKASGFVKNQGLMTYEAVYKNWDSLAILSILLKNTQRNSHILDAGGELVSTILPWLSFYGYVNLNCINLSIKASNKLGNIKYEYGDITKTKFASASFDAIICQSVIEHGVDLESYFKEASRLLKKKGLLVTSTDYWSEKIDTMGKKAYGAPVHIFTKGEIIEAIQKAKKYSLIPIEKLDLECGDKVVKWNGLEYTFIYFTLKKK